MASTSSKFGPSKFAEKIVGILLPPACREHVLGDLHERYQSPHLYLAEVVLTVPMVIASQSRRTSDPVVRFMEAFLLYGSFLAVANAGGKVLAEPFGLIRLAIPGAITLLGLVLADAYANPAKHPPLRPVLGVLIGLGAAFLVQVSLLTTAWALPPLVMLCGAGFSLLLVSTLRMIFPPFHDRPRGANGPAFWQNQEIAGVDKRLLMGIGMVVLVIALGAFAGGLPLPPAVVMVLLLVGWLCYSRW